MNMHLKSSNGAYRELKDMPCAMIIDVACQLEKVLEFLVKAGFNHDKSRQAS